MGAAATATVAALARTLTRALTNNVSFSVDAAALDRLSWGLPHATRQGKNPVKQYEMSRTPGSCVRYDYLGSVESIIANKVAASGFLASLTWKLKSLTMFFSAKSSVPHDIAIPDPKHATLLFDSDAQNA
jgi:hypothetical protein